MQEKIGDIKYKYLKHNPKIETIKVSYQEDVKMFRVELHLESINASVIHPNNIKVIGTDIRNEAREAKIFSCVLVETRGRKPKKGEKRSARLNLRGTPDEKSFLEKLTEAYNKKYNTDCSVIDVILLGADELKKNKNIQVDDFVSTQ